MVLGAGGFNLGNAFGKVIIDPSGVNAGMQQARQAFDSGLGNIGAGLRSVGGQIAGVGASLSILTAPIALFGAQGVQAASNFEDSLKEIEVRARLTTDEMERVRAKALQMGADTVFSAGQGAEAFLQLLTTGQSVEEAFSTIDAVMAGAAASGADLGVMADSVTDIMAQFNMEASESEQIVDALAKASGASSATMNDLMQGFQNVGGVANSFGLSVWETSSILATFSENGIKGAEAGTQLRSMLNNMMRPTDDVRGMWAKLGVSLFDSSGRMRHLNLVIKDMNVAMAGMTQQQRLEAIQTLAGSYGQLGLTALLNADGFGAMMLSMMDATDASEVAEAKMDTFSGSVESLRGSVETLQINALTPLMENSLKPIVQTVTDVVNSINDWVVANPELASTLMTIMGIVLAAGPVLIGIGGAISLIGTALSGLGVIIGIVTSPISLLIAGIAGITLGLDALGIIDLEGIIGAVGRFVSALGAGVPVGDAFTTLIGDLFGSEAQATVVGWLQTVSDFITNTALPALENLRDWFLTTALPAIRDFVTNTVQPAIQAFFDVIGGAWLIISVGLNSLKDWFVTTGLPVIQSAIAEAQRIWGLLQTALTDLWTVVKPYLEPIVNWFRDTFQWIGENYIKPVLDFVNGIITKAGEALEMLRQLGGGGTGEIQGSPSQELGDWAANHDYFGPYDPNMAYMVGTGAQPELFMPNGRGGGTAIPNADQLFGGGGDTFGDIYINASTYEGGQAAARGFKEEIAALRRSRK